MKKALPLNKLLAFFTMAMLVAASLFAIVSPVLAAEPFTIGEVRIGPGETHQGDLSVSLGELVVDGHVTGEVKNNLGSIVIRGSVGNDTVSNVGEIRVETNGQVAGDVRTTAGAITIRGDVGGDVITMAGTVTVRGRVGGDVDVESGEVTISGEVGGDIRVIRGVVRLQDGAVVRGQVHVDEGWVDFGSGASAHSVHVRHERRDGWRNDFIRGGVVTVPLFNGDWARNSSAWLASLAVGGIWGAVRAIVMTVLGIAVLALFPHAVKRMGDAVIERPGHSLGVGVLSIVGMPIAIILLAISILGIIVIPFAIVGMILVGLFGHIVMALVVGRIIAQRITGTEQEPWHEFIQLAVGMLLIAVAGFIPLFGWAVRLAVFLFGVGAVIMTLFRRRPRPDVPPAAS